MSPSAPERLTRKTTSLAELLARRVRDTPDREAYRYPVGDQWRSMTWRQSGERARAIAAGPPSLGLERDPRAVDDAVAGIQGEHLATLIYTSGTTGKPKGVRLLHECWAYCADAIEATRLWVADDVTYLWLPMSHSFGKILMAGHIASGSVTAVDGRIPKLVPNLAVVRPTIMAAVPRIFEK